MRLNLGWVAAGVLVAGGCFSEPPSSSSSTGGEASSGTSGVGPTTSSGQGEVSDTTDSTANGDSSTSLEPATNTTDPFDTEGDVVEVLFDFYARSCDGVWETPAFTPPEPVDCALLPQIPNTEGGVWKYPQFNTPTFPDEIEVLILRPFPADGESVEGRFSAGDLPTGENATLALGWEFVNTQGPEDTSRMTFQLRLLQPSGGGTTIASAIGEGIGKSGTVDIPLDELVMGPLDELYFFVTSDTYAEGRGVALYSAVIYEAP